jgi:hypothetical protein
MMTLLRTILNSWAGRRLFDIRIRRQIAQFEALTHRPRAVQDALLRRILTQQARTEFGRDHGFWSISSRAAFRRRVPIQRYEDLEPYIARCRRGELSALLSEPCVHMFALTSGTTAARKYIPVTPQYLRDYQRGWNIWGLRVWQDHPEVRLRPIVQFAGNWNELQTEAGIPCGALTGLTARMQKRIVRWLYCTPADAGAIKDARAKNYLTLRFSVPRQVGMLIAANPSSLIALARTADEEKETLIRDVYQGTISPTIRIPDELQIALSRQLRPDRALARKLESAAQRSGTLYPRDIWSSAPYLIGTWTGGSVGAYVRQLPKYYGQVPVRDVGLIASEGRMTIPIADRTAGGVLDIQSHYFEFVPEHEIDNPRPTVLSADEVQEGRTYFILLTTTYGLYRYNLCDLVRVTGFHNRTPIVEFLGKGSHFSNLTGEKLSEYQVTGAMNELCRAFGLNLTSYSVAPCWSDARPYYGLFVEANDIAGKEQGRLLAQMLDQRLAEMNCEYASKRQSYRLGAPGLALLPPGAWREWDRRRLARTGGAWEQYKHPCLINDLNFRDSITVLEEISPNFDARHAQVT